MTVETRRLPRPRRRTVIVLVAVVAVVAIVLYDVNSTVPIEW